MAPPASGGCGNGVASVWADAATSPCWCCRPGQGGSLYHPLEKVDEATLTIVPKGACTLWSLPQGELAQCMPPIADFANDTHAEQITFDQCALNAASKKPTGLTIEGS